MTRYFFHIHSPLGCSPDEEGQVHADLATAYQAAIVGLREIVSFGILHGELRTSEWIEISDATGERLARVSFTNIFEASKPQLLRSSRVANDC